VINLIAAIGVNRELGYKNQLLCHLPNDLKHFKELTQGNICVMGRKTYESIGKPLPNRQNVILTHQKDYEAPSRVYVYHSVEDILKQYESYGNKEMELFIIGGEQIYKQFLKYADRIYLTIIEKQFSRVDTYFPPFSFLEWKVTSRVRQEIDQDNPYVHHFVTYERREYNNK
jgi:dihydrofolate reductase